MGLVEYKPLYSPYILNLIQILLNEGVYELFWGEVNKFDLWVLFYPLCDLIKIFIAVIGLAFYTLEPEFIRLVMYEGYEGTYDDCYA